MRENRKRKKMTTEGKLGSRIRRYREKLGLTQEQLALNAGLDAAFLADVEADRIYPPIGSIIRLSRALGQRVGTFMDDQYLPDPIIMRRDALHEETDSSRGAKGHYHYFPLGSGKTDRHMEPFYIRIEVDEEKAMSSHEGEEFMAVITGKIMIRYGTTEQILEKGDTVYYNSVVPHFVGAVDGPAEILAVLYVPN